MTRVEAHITGTVWKIECAVGDTVEEGDTVAILESMKMEMPVEAEDAGTVVKICCEEGQSVNEATRWSCSSRPACPPTLPHASWATASSSATSRSREWSV